MDVQKCRERKDHVTHDTFFGVGGGGTESIYYGTVSYESK